MGGGCLDRDGCLGGGVFRSVCVFRGVGVVGV